MKKRIMNALDIVWKMWITSVVILFLFGCIGFIRGYSMAPTITAGPGEQVEYCGEILTLDKNEFFVMGDNRDFSVDSRYFGPVQSVDILGVMVL